MKKLFILLLLMISMFFCACTGCSTKPENSGLKGDSIDSLVIEDTVLMDTLQKEGSIKWSVTMNIDTINDNVVVKNPVIKI